MTWTKQQMAARVAKETGARLKLLPLSTLTLGQVILNIASLGFLGIGVASPTPEWGTIISENKINIQAYPYLGLIPGICICLTVMAVNFIGDGLRDAFDPRTKK